MLNLKNELFVYLAEYTEYCMNKNPGTKGWQTRETSKSFSVTFITHKVQPRQTEC